MEKKKKKVEKYYFYLVLIYFLILVLLVVCIILYQYGLFTAKYESILISRIHELEAELVISDDEIRNKFYIAVSLGFIIGVIFCCWIDR